MNWFQRHLNWTVVLAAVVAYAIVGTVVTFLSVSESPDFMYVPLIFIPPAIILPVAGWALKRKNRSLWWLLIFFIPFGWIVFLCLENRRYLLEQGEGIRNSLLTDVREITKLTTLQRHQADLYDNTLVKYGYSIRIDTVATNELTIAAKNLADVATDIENRFNHFPQPHERLAHFRLAWQQAFRDYRAWAEAQYASVSALTEGRTPITKKVKELHKASERSGKLAVGERDRLLALLKITPGEIERLSAESAQV